MQERELQALLTQRRTIRQRWELLLRKEPVLSPLGRPETLVYMMDWTLDRLFEQLKKAKARSAKTAKSQPCQDPAENCACGMNPLLAYFRTLRTAVVETLLTLSAPTGHDTQVTQVVAVINNIAQSEIDTLCAVCRHRETQRTTQPQSAISTQVLH